MAEKVDEAKADEEAAAEKEKDVEDREKLSEEQIKKAVKEILTGAILEEDKHSKILCKPNGNASDMYKDLEALPVQEIIEKDTDKGRIRVGTFSNGWKAVARHSTDGRLTLEIQMNGRSVKIRYGIK